MSDLWSIDGQTPAFLAATRMASLNDANVSAILAELDIESGMRVLDVGCGSGEYCIRLGSHLTGVDFTGADLDPLFVQFANERASGSVGYPFEQPNPDNAYLFVCANGLDLPFEDGSFDVVVSHTYLTAVPEWERALAEMVRVCKLGGTVSSITSLTDDFYGTGEVGLFAGQTFEGQEDLAMRIFAAKSKVFASVPLTEGAAPRDVPAAFDKAGLADVRCRALGHYFCLSDASLDRVEYMRHLDLLKQMETDDLDRLASDLRAHEELDPGDLNAYAAAIEQRYVELADACGNNHEWNWYGNSSLLVCGKRV